MAYKQLSTDIYENIIPLKFEWNWAWVHAHAKPTLVCQLLIFTGAGCCAWGGKDDCTGNSYCVWVVSSLWAQLILTYTICIDLPHWSWFLDPDVTFMVLWKRLRDSYGQAKRHHNKEWCACQQGATWRLYRQMMWLNNLIDEREWVSNVNWVQMVLLYDLWVCVVHWISDNILFVAVLLSCSQLDFFR
jgi:hypothetical protein